jgi:hypothetical protein
VRRRTQMMRATGEDDYFWIRQWGQHVGSDRDAIEREVERARRDRAPDNAIYYEEQLPDSRSAPGGSGGEQKREHGMTGIWRTTSGITDTDTRLALERAAGRPLPENEERGG